MRAMTLSNNPETTKLMKFKSEHFLNEAQRIKSSHHWNPSKRPQVDATKLPKLPEPVSSRKLPTSEQILLLKASQLNGFKFPPWKDTPEDHHFELLPGQQLFT